MYKLLLFKRLKTPIKILSILSEINIGGTVATISSVLKDSKMRTKNKFKLFCIGTPQSAVFNSEFLTGQAFYELAQCLALLFLSLFRLNPFLPFISCFFQINPSFRQVIVNATFIFSKPSVFFIR